MITVFTPTFNRAYSLPNLYASLCRQTCKDFEWLVVDDGSTDNTTGLFDAWIKETEFPIRYVKQENGGKHRAINHGVRLARGDLFFIVDSDDYLTDNAIEKISGIYAGIAANGSFAGLAGLKTIAPGNVSVSTGWKEHDVDTTSIDIRYKYGIEGDLAEVFRTDILRQFPFPEIEKEKFCTEALVWNRIAKAGYKLRYTQVPIYICEYRADGLTAASVNLRRRNPIATTLFYAELAHMPVPLLVKFKAQINFWRFAGNSSCRRAKKLRMFSFLMLISWPFGSFMRFNDSRR